MKAYLTTFALTLTNPATILAFVGMISGLSKGAEAGPHAAYWLVIGVFCGSALWWFFLVGITTMVRGFISDRFMRVIDFVSGGILSLWGAWMLYEGATALL